MESFLGSRNAFYTREYSETVKNIHRMFLHGERNILHKAMLDSHDFYLFVFLIIEELRDMVLLPFILYFRHNSFPFLTDICNLVRLFSFAAQTLAVFVLRS